MKYCIDFYGKDIDILKEVDEINIDISRIKDLQNDLQDFCELHKEQRINLCINNYEDAINNKTFVFCFKFQQDNPQYNIYIRLP